MESWVQSWRPRTNAFCICSIHLSKLLRLPGKMMLGHTKCCTCHAKSSQQTWRSDAPKCNPSQEITRRFSEPTFRPSGATNHLKNAVICDFSTFSRSCIFFLLTLSLLWSSLFYSSLFYSSLLSDSSHLCFSSVHIVGSLTSKLPLMNLWTIADFQFTDGCWFCTNSWASVGRTHLSWASYHPPPAKWHGNSPGECWPAFPADQQKRVLSKGITLSSCPSSPS